jgi:class 3 adenylate cyclase
MMPSKLAQLLRMPQTSFANWLTPAEYAIDGSLWSVLRGLRRDARTALLPRVEPAERRVTLLVTDLVGFTHLTETLGDRAAHTLIRAHNTLLRACLREREGREVAHTGDGIISCFERAPAALHCAIAMQRRLQRFSRENPSTPLSARIGVHAGRPLPEEGRLFGACVNTAVRVCAAAAPETVLVSHLARALAGSQFSYEDQGWFELKGLSDPHRLHALSWREA